MIQIFKKNNSSWTNTKVCITDKDMVQRNVLKSEMPQIMLQICLFHVMKIFSNQLTTEKMGVTVGERDTIKELITECCYAYSHEDYLTKYDALMEVCNNQVKDYFDDNWHNITDEWVD